MEGMAELTSFGSHRLSLDLDEISSEDDVP